MEASACPSGEGLQKGLQSAWYRKDEQLYCPRLRQGMFSTVPFGRHRQETCSFCHFPQVELVPRRPSGYDPEHCWGTKLKRLCWSAPP